MRCGKDALATAGIVLVLGTSAAADTGSARHVTVRVHDHAGLGVSVWRGATASADAALASASIGVEWQLCEVSVPAAPCATAARGEYVVRVVRAAEDVGPHPQPLGDALVDMTTGSGGFATISFQRVHRLASAAGTDAAVLLGYAIAHELGHLMLASNLHNSAGLMRPVWREREVRLDREADWRFTPADTAAIHDRIDSRRRSP